MIKLSAKAFVFGIITAFLGFSIIQDEFVTNIFGMVLILSVISGNLFVLLIGTFLSIQTTPKKRKVWSSVSCFKY